jgi:hypothetical protein
VIAEQLVLRGDPEAVASADHPLPLACPAELVGVVFQYVAFSGPPVDEDAGANVKRGDNLNIVIGKAQAAGPSAVGDGLWGGCRRGQGVRAVVVMRRYASIRFYTETRIGIST